MIIRKAFQFKLKPTVDQVQSFWQYAGATRWVWNEMLAERKETYKETGKSPSQYAQMRRLTELKREPDTGWLRTIHSQVLQEPIKNLQRAFENFFAGRASYPRFKSKRNTTQSFCYPQGVKVDGCSVYLPKIGWVHFRKSREIEGVIKRATVRHKESGWYVSIQVEIEQPDLPTMKPTPATTVGVDLGLNQFLVPSEGQSIANPRHLRKAERKLARAQRTFSRRTRGSNRYRKQREKIAKLHERVSNARKDFLHKLSRQLVNENQAIIAEDLSVKGLARTRLAKSVHDAGWGEFLRQLAYKCEWEGKTFHQIDRFFPSTKTCNNCGQIHTLSLSDRRFVCDCGYSANRDRNAARNIKAKGLSELNVAAGQTETLTARGGAVRLAMAS